MRELGILSLYLKSMCSLVRDQSENCPRDVRTPHYIVLKATLTKEATTRTPRSSRKLQELTSRDPKDSSKFTSSQVLAKPLVSSQRALQELCGSQNRSRTGPGKPPDATKSSPTHVQIQCLDAHEALSQAMKAIDVRSPEGQLEAQRCFEKALRGRGD